MKKIYFLLLGFGACIFCLFLWGKQEIQAPLAFKQSVVIELPKGAGASVLASKLLARGVLKNTFLFRLISRFQGYDQCLKAGEYELTPNMTIDEILNKICSGKVVMHTLTLPEGLTTTQMIKIIEQSPYLTGDLTEDAAEGEILPETYTFVKGESKNKILRLAKEAMQKELEEIWQGRNPDLPLHSKNELLVLASIIEKETGVSSEREMVSSVFVNRLNKNMLLQTDPTVIYALTLGKEELKRPLYRQDLAIDSVFNTYKYKGLPPYPICNPGIESIKAAAHPAQSPYFYFVANGKGGHNFAKTLREHTQNVRLWLGR